jgi:hypothetical protein
VCSPTDRRLGVARFDRLITQTDSLMPSDTNRAAFDWLFGFA